MSHFKPYPSYKNTGIEWLGRLPPHWDVKRLRFAAIPKNSNVDKKSYEGQQEVRLCNYTDVYYNATISADLEFKPSTASDEEVQDFSLRAGDVIITKDSETADDIGIPAYVPETLPGVVCGYHLTILRSHGVDGEYLFRLFQTHLTKAYFFVEVSGVTRFGLSQDAIKNVAVPIPSKAEQRVITQHLSSETARIDALVAKKTRFIELLREKRQALITHAVTNGLDPNVKMKGSGVEWLGEVPEHWRVIPLKWDLSFLTSGSRGWAENYADDGALFIRIGNLTRASFELDLSDIQRVAVPDGAESERTKVRPGDLLFSITAYLGSVALIPSSLEPAYVSQHVALARLSGRVLTPTWAGYVALSWVGKAYLEAQGYGGTKIQLSLDDIANLIMTAPPIDEQLAIANYLNGEVPRINTLITKTERSIDLLKERRAALITAAVTGQIDLREAA